MEYFISDFHFGHENSLSFERWNFSTIEEHDNAILSLLKHKLTSTDILYFLGDLGFPTEEVKEKLRALPCKIIMIKGNHDKNVDAFYKKQCGFDEVYDHPIWLSKRLVISHIPIPVENGVINIHGHIHGGYICKENYVNVNIHMLNYKLYPIKEAMKLMGKLEKPNYSFLCEWYNGLQIMSQDQINHRDDMLYDSDHIIRGYSAKGLYNHNPEERKLINKKNLLYKTIRLDDIQYTIVDISEDGLTLTLVNMSNGQELKKPLADIKELEGYGLKWMKN